MPSCSPCQDEAGPSLAAGAAQCLGQLRPSGAVAELMRWDLAGDRGAQLEASTGLYLEVSAGARQGKVGQGRVGQGREGSPVWRATVTAHNSTLTACLWSCRSRLSAPVHKGRCTTLIQVAKGAGAFLSFYSLLVL